MLRDIHYTWLASDRDDSTRSDNVVNVVPRQMGTVVEEGGPYFHSGRTTCTHSSSRDLTLTPMRMSMPMPTTTSTSTTTSTRYRLPGTLIASHLPTITSRITTTITTTITRATITIIAIIITIITITTTTTIRFKSISISPEISVIETPVSICKVTRKPEDSFTECSSSFSLFLAWFFRWCSFPSLVVVAGLRSARLLQVVSASVVASSVRARYFFDVPSML